VTTNQPTIPMHQLITFLDRLAGEQITNRLLAERRERTHLYDGEIVDLHKVGETYASEALDYMRIHGSDRDLSMVPPATALINATRHALNDLAEIGLPNVHLADHGMDGLRSTALAVLVWCRITQGHIDALAAFTKARNAIGV
jgi:hypothetical protein